MAVMLVLGRYSGYRLSELFRFRALAREAEAREVARNKPVPAAPAPEAPQA